MKFDFVVFGATGMQGRIVTRDLLENGYSVLLCGRGKSRIEHFLRKYKKTGFEYLDLKDINRATEIIKKSGASVVANCAEGDWDLNSLKACLKAGVSSVDLGSEIPMTKEQLKLDKEHKNKNIIHITGCGSVPGVGNVMLRYAAEKFDKIHEIEVGFAWDSNIKKFVVPFSIPSIVEEFTDPAPLIINKKMVNVKPLDSIVTAYHKSIGREKCFHVRHPETYTFYHYYKNKGLKNVKFYAGFPDHSFNVIKNLIDLGLASEEDIDYKGMKIAPVDFVTEVLRDLKFPDGYKEYENLWVEIFNGNKVIKMECLVPTLAGWEDAGCNIDTGMPASIIAQMIKTGVINKPGCYAPEAIVPPEPFFRELRKRKMHVLENGKIIN